MTFLLNNRKAKRELKDKINGSSLSFALSQTLDAKLNRTLAFRTHLATLRKKTVNEVLRPTPTDDLPILAGIQPAQLRRREATLSWWIETFKTLTSHCMVNRSGHLSYGKRE